MTSAARPRDGPLADAGLPRQHTRPGDLPVLSPGGGDFGRPVLGSGRQDRGRHGVGRRAGGARWRGGAAAGAKVCRARRVRLFADDRQQPADAGVQRRSRRPVLRSGRGGRAELLRRRRCRCERWLRGCSSAWR
ncbi:MAG: hypothetical protein MZW92_21295 [Comamonadaceae bacterium]|nr:hypothetical protein [Comamonadaceae bacterium]